MARLFSTEWREPHNLAAKQPGIHDDATAQRLGFVGGTVAGNVHMNQLVPLAVDAFGASHWFQRGVLSTYFLHPTTHKAPVRAHLRIEEGDGVPATVWMETKDGTKVLEGTASIHLPSSGQGDTAVGKRLARCRPPQQPLRILKNVPVGKVTPTYSAKLLLYDGTHDSLEKVLDSITEKQEVYEVELPEWGGRVLPPQAIVHLISQALEKNRVAVEEWGVKGRMVGLYGGIELRVLRGPVVVGKDYGVKFEVLALTDSPKTEGLWYKATLMDGEGVVVEMLMMIRYMKASSPLYEESKL